MKLSWLVVPALVAAVNAQYFSEGWKPGQPAPTDDSPNLAEDIYHTFERYGRPVQTKAAVAEGTEPTAEAQKKRPKRLSELLNLNSILTSKPVAALFEKAGINITETLGKGLEPPWDKRISLITDENYEDIIVNETLTEEEEKTRTWFLLITGDLANAAGAHQIVDQAFDEAYNETILANDLPDLRWGRVDYLNVTYLTTKWGVWQSPMLVIVKDRGQTLRFLRPMYLRLRDGGLRDFLVKEYYLNIDPWSSSFAPGGSREYLMHYLALGMMNLYNTLVVFPKWVLYLVSGSVASFLIQLMHRSPPRQQQQQPQPPQEQPSEASTDSTQQATSNATAVKKSSTTAKQRKGKRG